jgi:hypothetical protein
VDRATHLVQLGRGSERAAAIADGNVLHLLAKWTTVYDLALEAIRRGLPVSEFARNSVSGRTLDYDPVYSGESEWRLLCPIDHPGDPARLMVSGTGLTHKVSAENRAAMHRDAAPAITDSMRMFQLGKEGGQPAAGCVGVQPEWFYKGNGSVLRAHGEALPVPCYALDGGEEPEVAGAYVIADDGRPCRIGFMAGNEFSDHAMEKQNYLYLAHSKLRNCSVGPELVAGGGELFRDLAGTVTVERKGAALWKASIYSGEKNMCHSLANLEHHHFKYEAHRRPGDVHVHFFGADAFSFGEGVRLADSDVAEISFPGLGRPLRNPVRIQPEEEQLVAVAAVG